MQIQGFGHKFWHTPSLENLRFFPSWNEYNSFHGESWKGRREISHLVQNLSPHSVRISALHHICNESRLPFPLFKLEHGMIPCSNKPFKVNTFCKSLTGKFRVLSLFVANTLFQIFIEESTFFIELTSYPLTRDKNAMNFTTSSLT